MCVHIYVHIHAHAWPRWVLLSRYTADRNIAREFLKILRMEARKLRRPKSETAKTPNPT